MISGLMLYPSPTQVQKEQSLRCLQMWEHCSHVGTSKTESMSLPGKPVPISSQVPHALLPDTTPCLGDLPESEVFMQQAWTQSGESTSSDIQVQWVHASLSLHVLAHSSQDAEDFFKHPILFPVKSTSCSSHVSFIVRGRIVVVVVGEVAIVVLTCGVLDLSPPGDGGLYLYSKLMTLQTGLMADTWAFTEKLYYLGI